MAMTETPEMDPGTLRFQLGLAVREVDEGLMEIRTAGVPLEEALGQMRRSRATAAKALAAAWLGTLPKVTFDAVEVMSVSLGSTAFTSRLRSYSERLRSLGRAVTIAEARLSGAQSKARAATEAWSVATQDVWRTAQGQLTELDVSEAYGLLRKEYLAQRFYERSSFEWWLLPIAIVVALLPLPWLLRGLVVPVLLLVFVFRWADHKYRQRAKAQAAAVFGQDRPTLGEYFCLHDSLQTRFDYLEGCRKAVTDRVGERAAAEKMLELTVRQLGEAERDFEQHIEKDLAQAFEEAWALDGAKPWTQRVVMGWPVATQRAALELVFIDQQMVALQQALDVLFKRRQELVGIKARLLPPSTRKGVRRSNAAPNGRAVVALTATAKRSRASAQLLSTRVGDLYYGMARRGFGDARHDLIERTLDLAADVAREIGPDLALQAVDALGRVAEEAVSQGASLAEVAVDDVRRGLDDLMDASVVAFAFEGIEKTGEAIGDAADGVLDSVGAATGWLGLTDGFDGADGLVDDGSDDPLADTTSAFTDETISDNDAGGSSSGWDDQGGSGTSDDRPNDPPAAGNGGDGDGGGDRDDEDDDNDSGSDDD